MGIFLSNEKIPRARELQEWVEITCRELKDGVEHSEPIIPKLPADILKLDGIPNNKLDKLITLVQKYTEAKSYDLKSKEIDLEMKKIELIILQTEIEKTRMETRPAMLALPPITADNTTDQWISANPPNPTESCDDYYLRYHRAFPNGYTLNGFGRRAGLCGYKRAVSDGVKVWKVK